MRGVSYGNIVAGVFAFIVVAFCIFLLALAIKSGVDGTSFVDTWNTVFEIESTPVEPVEPDIPVEPVEEITTE